MFKRGFSLVELTIVIAIMAALLVLGVVNLRGSQANERDVERRTDVETIAQHLETFFTSSPNTNNTPSGSYPSTDLFGNETAYLPDVDPKNLKAPGQDSSSLAVATNTNSPPGSSPALSIDTYVYQPLDSNGSLCTSTSTECTSFKLFYRIEVSDETCPNDICIITSKNQ